MPEAAEAVIAKLRAATQPGLRGRLTARGLARSSIWRNGELPPGAPNLGAELTQELLSYGFGILRLALKAREVGDGAADARRAFELAGDAFASIIRHGDLGDDSAGFYTVVAGAAYQLGQYSARAFSVLTAIGETKTSVVERTLALLLQRKLDKVFELIGAELLDPANSDETAVARLEDESDDFDIDEALAISGTENYLRAIAAFVYALRSNDSSVFRSARERLLEGEALCRIENMVCMWWIYRLTLNIVDDLWKSSIQQLLPRDPGDGSNWDALRELYTGLLLQRSTAEIDLWPSQKQAAERVLNAGDNIVASLPTSAGKTRIAELCILRALSLGTRVVFVTPLRSLSAQTENILRNTFAPLGHAVSALYGGGGSTPFDLDSLGNRPIVVSTPEKLDFALRNNPDILNDVGLVVLDEGHMLGPTEREVRYEVLIQRLLRRPDANHRRIVCLSAMLPSGEELDDFVTWLRRDNPGDAIKTSWRPTRLKYGRVLWDGKVARYELGIDDETTAFIPTFFRRQLKTGPRGGKTYFPATRNDLAIATAWQLAEEGSSVLIYCPERRSVNAIAKQVLRAIKSAFLKPLPIIDAAALRKVVLLGQEWLGDHPVVQCLAAGVAIHHAVLPKPFLRALDGLIRDRKIGVVVASPTLARGLNISASCVIFQALTRFDYTSKAPQLITPEEFGNVAGRAGRAYVDVDGQVLGMCFSYDDTTKWKSVLKQHQDLKLESGLIGIAAQLYHQLKGRFGAQAEDWEYIANMSAIWTTEPAVPEDKNGWDEAVAILDIALFSLLGENECDPSDLAAQLDAVLDSSFLRRRLRHYDQRAEKIVNAILLGRARYIWTHADATARRSYFYCGVGMSAGKKLDEAGDKLTRLLADADEAFQVFDLAGAIEATTELADVIFGIEPFAPSVLPERWKDILQGWLSGVGTVHLLDISDDAQVFIDEALSYKLVWGLESVRVRALAHGDSSLSAEPSPLVAALETGASTIQQALLLQAGLASREAAQHALNSCPANFENLYGMREWLMSEDVMEATKRPNWPTSSSRPAWLEFVQANTLHTHKKWQVLTQDIAMQPSGEDTPTEGTPVFLWQRDGETRITVYSPDLRRLATTAQHFKAGYTKWSCGEVLKADSVRFKYVGPTSN